MERDYLLRPSVQTEGIESSVRCWVGTPLRWRPCKGEEMVSGVRCQVTAGKGGGGLQIKGADTLILVFGNNGGF